MPEIEISLELPNLSEVVQAFTAKNYHLADNDLLLHDDLINNIDLIIGIDSFPLFFNEVIKFGDDDPSAYFASDAGILMTGNIDKMLSNVVYLPYFVSNEKVHALSDFAPSCKLTCVLLFSISNKCE